MTPLLTHTHNFDEQLQCLVHSNAHTDLSSLNDLLPLCSLEARKNALKYCVSVQNENIIAAVARHCAHHNEFTAIEINNFITAAVISQTNTLVEILAPFSPKDFNLLRMSILLKKITSSHILIDYFGFDDESFELAAQMGMESVVEKLLPLSEPKNNNSEASYQAVGCNHQNCVDLLYDLSDPKAVVQRLNDNFPHHTTSVWDDFKARVERDVLQENIGNVGIVRTPKM